jgi:hypothetical protein
MVYSFLLDVLTLVKVQGFYEHTNDIIKNQASISPTVLFLFQGVRLATLLLSQINKEGVEKPWKKKLTVIHLGTKYYSLTEI